jgi:hypothetical protein
VIELELEVAQHFSDDFPGIDKISHAGQKNPSFGQLIVKGSGFN